MKKFLLVSAMLLTFLIGGEIIYAQGTSDIFPKKDKESFFRKKDNTKGGIKLTDYTVGVNGGQDSSSVSVGAERNRGEFLFRRLVNRIANYMKRILIPVAVIWTIWAGLSLVLSRGEEEEFTKRWNHIYGLAIGFIIILLAGVTVDNVFFGEKGEIIREEVLVANGEVASGMGYKVVTFAKEGVKQMKGIFKYFTSFAVLAGVAYIIFSSVKMLLAGGEDESQISKLKQRIVFVVTGMIVLVSAPEIVKIFTQGPKADSLEKLTVPHSGKLIELAINWVNFILGLVGVFAIFGIVWGGFRLVSSFGADEQAAEEAKKIVWASVLGLIVAFSAWTLTYYFLVHDAPVTIS